LFRLVTYVPDNVLTPLINLTITLVDNGIYQITGKWPTTIAGTADIVEIARLGAGEPLDPRRETLRRAHRPLVDGGPILLAAKIDDQRGMSTMIRNPALIRNRFMQPGDQQGRRAGS
jgi:hypothetical protein